MEDKLFCAIIGALIVLAPFAFYIWQGRNGGIG